MLQLTVDLSDDKATLVKAAQIILEFAGYDAPKGVDAPKAPEVPPQPSAADALIEQARAISRQSSLSPAEVFTNTTPSARDVFNAATREHDAINDRAAQALLNAPPPPVESLPAFVGVSDLMPPAPPAPAAPPPPPAAGIDVDSRGLPWDARIHASTRAKTTDGSWRQKRNVDPNLLTVVESELRATMSAAPVPPAPFAGNAAPPAPPITGTPSVPVSAGAATTASPGDGPAPTFPQLMAAITKGFTSGTITKPQIDAAVAAAGLPSLPMLASRPDLVAAVASALGIAL